MSPRTITTSTFLAALMSVAAEGAPQVAEPVTSEPHPMAALMATKDVRVVRATPRAQTQPG